MNDTSDWYEVLGVATTADATIIKAAYRARAKNLHPDSAHATDQQEFARINRAYEILSDPARRAAYDAERERQAASQTTPQSPETGPDPDDYEDTWGTEGTWGDEPSHDPHQFASTDPRKLAGFDVWESMSKSAGQISWLPEARRVQQEQTNGVSNGQTKVEERGTRSTGSPARRLVIWAGIWLVAVIIYGSVGSMGDAGSFGVGAFFGAFLFGLPYGLGVQNGFVKFWQTLYYVFAVLTLPVALLVLLEPTTAFGAVADQPGPGAATALVLADVAVAVSYGFTLRAARKLRGAAGSTPPAVAYDGELISAEAADTYSQWGDPGRGLNNPQENPFPERQSELGFEGEVLTSQLIDELTAIPGVKVVHGINLPDFGKADIDHVILCGDLLIPVDSKNWSGGSYYWLSGQVMATTAWGLQRRGAPMAWALEPLRQLFPDKQVVPVIVIHSHVGEQVVTNNQAKGPNATLMSPEEFVEQVGRMCLDQRAQGVDRAALTRLIRLLA